MATLYINELGRPTADGRPVPPALATQTVTYTVSAQSEALNTATRTVQVFADAVAHLAFGADPTATAASHAIPANTLVEIEAPLTDGTRKIAAYDGST